MRALLLFLLSALTFVLAACGGSGHRGPESSEAYIRMRIAWPESSRLIPRATQSIRVDIFRQQQLVRTVVAERPANQTESNLLMGQLPATDLRLEITARPGSNGAGTPLAKATANVRTRNEETTEVSVTLESTITEISLEPLAVVGRLGDRVTVEATAFDAEGRLVLVAEAAWDWKILGSKVAQIEPRGELCIVEIISEVDGDDVLTCTETESSKSRSIAVKPEANLGFAKLEVTPDQVCPVGYSRRLSFHGRAGLNFDAPIVIVDPDIVEWEVENPGILSVQPDGFVFGEAVGVTRVRVRAGSIVSEPVEVTVVSDDRFRVHRWIHIHPTLGPVDAQIEINRPTGEIGPFYTYLRGFSFESVSPWFAPGFNVPSARLLTNGIVVGDSGGILPGAEFATFVIFEDPIQGSGDIPILVQGTGFPQEPLPQHLVLGIIFNGAVRGPFNLSILDSEDDQRGYFNVFGVNHGSGIHLTPIFAGGPNFPSGKAVLVVREGFSYYDQDRDVYRTPAFEVRPNTQMLQVIYHQNGNYKSMILPATPYP